MNKLSLWFYQVSTGWVALAGLVIFILFTALVLPKQAAQADVTGGEAGSPDMSFVYSAQDLYAMAEAYGDAGRDAYIRARLTFDVIWPIVYTLFLVTSISWLYARAFPPESRWRWANLAPVLGMLFDYLENLSTSWVMFRYPVPADLVAGVAPLFTATKWIFVNGSFVLLVIGGGVALWRLIRDNRG